MGRSIGRISILVERRLSKMLLTQYLEHVGRRLYEDKLVVVFIDDWPLARWHAVIEKDEIFEYFNGLANRIMEM